MKKSSKREIEIESLVNAIIAEDLEAAGDMFVDAAHPSAEITQYLVDMILSHHTDWLFIYEVWEEEIFFNVWWEDGLNLELPKVGDESQWLILQARIQCELLSYSDSEVFFEQYRVFSDQDPTPTGMAVNGILRVLANEPFDAIEQYEKACSSLVPASNYKIVPGVPAFYFALAILKTENQANAVLRLEKLILMYKSAYPEDEIVTWLETLHGFASVSNNGTSIEKLGWLVDNYRNATAWFVLVRCVCLHWLRLEPSAAMLRSLELHSKKAFNADMMWFVSQASYLLSNYGDDRSHDNLYPEGAQWLCDYIEPVVNWQVRLRQIEAIAGGGEQALPGNAEAGKQRVIWCVGDVWDGLVLEPRLQKLAKNGRWSKGRLLSLSELSDKKSAVCDLLTDHAGQLVESLVNESYRRHGYLEVRAPIKVDNPELIELVANIGDLYRVDSQKNSRFVPLKISLEKPNLEVIKKPGADAIVIRLVPFFEPDRFRRNPWLISWVTPEHLQITVYSTEQLALAKSLGEEGLEIPAEGKERVLSSLRNLVPMIDVLSDVGEEGLENIKEVTADCIPHLELSPMQNGLLAALKFYPLGDSGLPVAPGEGHTVLLAEIDAEVCKTVRDFSLERKRADGLIENTLLATLDSQDDDFQWYIEGPEQSLELLASLQEVPDEVVIGWPEGQKLSMPKIVHSDRMTVKLSGKQDWLQLDGELQVDESQVIKMDVLLRLMDTSATGRFVTLDDGSMLALSRRLQAQLTALRSASDDGKVHRLASAVIDDATDQMAVTGSAEWTKRLKLLHQAASLEPVIPSGLNATLRDYQQHRYATTGLMRLRDLPVR